MCIDIVANMPPRTSHLRRPLESLFKRHAIPRRTLIAAPKENSGPLMERRADRELPAIQSPYRWLRTMPLFLAVMAASTFAIFNYQKQSSSVVTSALYALRTNPEARAVLGDEVYFANKIPWISGEINQLHGRIDISFWVKGTKQKALMKFKSNRKHRMGVVSRRTFGYFDRLDQY